MRRNLRASVRPGRVAVLIFGLLACAVIPAQGASQIGAVSSSNTDRGCLLYLSLTSPFRQVHLTGQVRSQISSHPEHTKGPYQTRYQLPYQPALYGSLFAALRLRLQPRYLQPETQMPGADQATGSSPLTQASQSKLVKALISSTAGQMRQMRGTLG